MTTIFFKATFVAILSLAACLALAVAIVPLLDGSVAVKVWTLLVVCPFVVAWPAGALTFWQAERLRSAHRDLARAHAQLAAAHRRLEDKASRDDMTGMLNRESFFAHIEGSRRRSDRGALLIIDADHFKRVNDSFGHLTGDNALLAIVAAITRAVRQGDVLGRIGGEEFGAFLVGATDAEAEGVAERIRREVEQIQFRPADGRPLPLTVSIGGTNCPPEASVSELMRAADGRLYAAKNAGRNMAVFGQAFSEAA